MSHTLPERILVTGGAGFIGSWVCAALLRQGAAVTVVDNLHPFYDPACKRRNLESLQELGCLKVILGDIRDRERMGAVFQEGRFDAVLHLAALAGVRPSIQEPQEYVSVNVLGTACLLDLAQTHGVSRFVLASSSSVYGNNKKVPFSEADPVDHPISPYAATKKAAELLAHTFHAVSGLSVTCLRFFTVYGPRQRPEMAIHRFCHLIARGETVPIFGDGSSRRDYTYVEDIVRGVVRALERCCGYRIYNLGGSRTCGLKELVALIEQALGKQALLEQHPMQAGDVFETFADISRARAELGFEPQVTLPDGIEGFVAWYKQQA